ncbi:peptidylprolyl isomerase [Chryseolinea sp. T2]|uniref:peptidylprolyl isomerase n=1 Tax=Chryseolinea sp. T2 TaxID=3129255 RepID=UPI003078996F
MLRLCLIFILFITLGACNKKEPVVITPQNLREVLTAYGKENPEDEVLIETSFGNITLKLYPETPLHRANFVKLIKDGYYEDADFYRIVAEFMIQGGDLNKKPGYRIPAEFNPNYIHKRGALSMARVDENNPDKESSGAEFFIVHGERYMREDVEMAARNQGLTLTPEQVDTYVSIGGYISLDKQYTTFGEVTSGMDVVDKIATVKVYNEDKPLKKIPFKISVVTR